MLEKLLLVMDIIKPNPTKQSNEKKEKRDYLELINKIFCLLHISQNEPTESGNSCRLILNFCRQAVRLKNSWINCHLAIKGSQ